MAFTSIRSTQNKFLETYLRGTDRTLTSAQAAALFDVQNLRARMSEFRSMGMRVTRVKTKTTGSSAYRVSRRDVFGQEYKLVA